MQVESKKTKGTLIVNVKGELDHHTAGVLKQHMDEMMEDPTINNIILDAKELGFMDSSGIGVLIGRYKVIAKRAGKMGVININSHIDRIFEISGLYRIIRSYSGLEEALKDMRGY